MYSDAINYISRTLLYKLGILSSYKADEEDIWAGKSRHIPKSINLNMINQDLSSYMTTVDLGKYRSYDSEKNTFAILHSSSLISLKKTLKSLHYALSGQNPQNEGIFFNSTNTGLDMSSHSAPAMIGIKEGALDFAMWVDPKQKNACLVSYLNSFLQGNLLNNRIPHSWIDIQFKGRQSPIVSHSLLNTPPRPKKVLESYLSSLEEKYIHSKQLRETTLINTNTHCINVHNDGSLVIEKKSSSFIDNPYGAAVITSSGHALYYNNNFEVSPKAFKRRNRSNRSNKNLHSIAGYLSLATN